MSGESTKMAAQRIRDWFDRVRIELLSLILSIYVALGCNFALAAEARFDPSSCKQSTGNMYVALGRYVFASPGILDGLRVIDPIPQSRRLKVPDPDESIGCFGNPLQSDSHALLHSVMVGSNSVGIPDLLSLHNLNSGYALNYPKEAEWPAEASSRQIAETTCREATIREDLPSGLIACRVRPVNPPDARQEDWGASYTARTNVYSTPEKKPFVVNCGPGLFSRGIGQCDVNYALNPDVGVSYQFQPFRGRHPIPADQIIAFDKSLRAAIEDAFVKDYPWPSQP